MVSYVHRRELSSMMCCLFVVGRLEGLDGTWRGRAHIFAELLSTSGLLSYYYIHTEAQKR